jgi:hypothetical protein
MANTKTDFFNIEEQAYQTKLAEMVGSVGGFSQDSIDQKIKQLDEMKDSSGVSTEEQKKALEEWNKLKNLNDAYQKFLQEKATAEKDLMANFTFYPGKKNENMFDSIDFTLGDGSKFRWKPNQDQLGAEIGASISQKGEFTIALPLNSTMEINYPRGPNNEPGESLKFSPGNKVEAKFSSGSMQVENFCAQTLLNWEKSGKKDPIFLDFSTIPVDAQPEIKRRVAQTLINLYADNDKFVSRETRQDRRNEIIGAITNVSQDGKPAAFSGQDLINLGVDITGKYKDVFTRNPAFVDVMKAYEETHSKEIKESQIDKLLNPVVEAMKSGNDSKLTTDQKELHKFFNATQQDASLNDPEKFEQKVQKEWNQLIRSNIPIIRKGLEIPVERLHEAWKDVHQHTMQEKHQGAQSKSADAKSLNRADFNEPPSNVGTSKKSSASPLSSSKGLEAKASSEAVSTNGAVSPEVPPGSTSVNHH